ncbi:MAG: hypothetical protein ABIZ80_25540 [Bryobacteraceae bacterium]
MSTVLLMLLLFQNVDFNPAIRASAEARTRDAALHQVSHLTKSTSPTAAAKVEDSQVAVNDKEFVGKFNHLIERLVDFADNYRNKQAMDVKKAKAIRQAWLDLEKAEAVFRDSSDKK